MSKHLAITVPTLAVLLCAPCAARADDPADALEELKQGYALKQAGKCRDAIPHFARSFQLDAKPKALLNWADCETQTGDLMAAEGHAAQGLQLARQANDAELAKVAQAQIAAIEARLPNLTIKLGPGAPPGSKVTRDGTPVDATLLGVAAAANPGKHSLLVTAPGYAQRTFEVTLTEGANRSIEVGLGPRLDVAGAAPTEDASGPPRPEIWPRTPLMYGALGVGGLGLVVGITAGLVASGKHSTLQGECATTTCPPSASGDLSAFHTWRDVSTVAYVVGALGVAGGVTLWLTTPKTSGTTVQAWFGPASAGIAARF